MVDDSTIFLYLRIAFGIILGGLWLRSAMLLGEAVFELKKYQDPLRASQSKFTFFDDVWLPTTPPAIQRKYIFSQRLGFVAIAGIAPLVWSLGFFAAGCAAAGLTIIMLVAVEVLGFNRK